jgi:gluconokinase
MNYTIGIDIGTGSIKAVALNYTGEILTRSQLAYPSAQETGIFEQDPLLITSLFINCIKEIIKKLNTPPSLIALSSYMHGIMAVDEQCRPMTNIITWADTRSETIASGIRASAGAEQLYRTTGVPIHSMLPLCKIIWWQQNEPGICQRAFKFISIKEFIWFQLFRQFQVDECIANATGLFDMANRKWSVTSIRLCGITEVQLSEIVPFSYIMNDVQPVMISLLDISKDTKFCIGGSDGCMAVIGSGAIKPGSASITIGTSAAVRIYSAKPAFHYPEMTFSYILNNNEYICGGPLNNGGNVMNWLLLQFSPHYKNDNYEELFKIIETMPAGSEGLLFLPYLYGERAPLWDERACGSFFGIKEQHTQHHFLRAAAEGICFALFNVLKIMEETVDIREIYVSGGFTKSNTWMQLLADVTGKKIILNQTDDASAIGAAVTGMKAAKSIGNYEDALITVNESVFQPDAHKAQRYLQLFPVFRKVSSSLKDVMHEIYDVEHK